MKVFPRAYVLEEYTKSPSKRTIIFISITIGYSVRQTYRHLKDMGVRFEGVKRDKNGRFTS